MEIQAIDMTTPLNVEMLKELRATLEALTAERTLDEQDNRKNPTREDATNAVMYGIRAFFTPLVRCVPSGENATSEGSPPSRLETKRERNGDSLH